MSLECDLEYTMTGCTVTENGDCKKCDVGYNLRINEETGLGECESTCMIDNDLWTFYLLFKDDCTPTPYDSNCNLCIVDGEYDPYCNTCDFNTGKCL